MNGEKSSKQQQPTTLHLKICCIPTFTLHHAESMAWLQFSTAADAQGCCMGMEDYQFQEQSIESGACDSFSRGRSCLDQVDETFITNPSTLFKANKKNHLPVCLSLKSVFHPVLTLFLCNLLLRIVCPSGHGET